MNRGKAIRCYRLSCSRCSREGIVDAPEGIDNKREIDGWMYSGWSGWTCPTCSEALGCYQCPRCKVIRLANAFGGYVSLASGEIAVSCAECNYELFKASVWNGRELFEALAQPLRCHTRRGDHE